MTRNRFKQNVMLDKEQIVLHLSEHPDVVEFKATEGRVFLRTTNLDRYSTLAIIYLDEQNVVIWAYYQGNLEAYFNYHVGGDGCAAEEIAVLPYGSTYAELWEVLNIKMIRQCIKHTTGEVN